MKKLLLSSFQIEVALQILLQLGLWICNRYIDGWLARASVFFNIWIVVLLFENGIKVFRNCGEDGK